MRGGRFLGGGEGSYQWVEHITRKEDTWDVNHVVATTTHTGGERTKTNCRRLTNDNPRCWRRTESEQHGDDKTKRCLRERGCVGFADGAGDSECHEENDVEARTPDVDGSATDVGREDPGEHDEDHLEGGGDETECEGGVDWDAGLCWVCQYTYSGKYCIGDKIQIQRNAMQSFVTGNGNSWKFILVKDNLYERGSKTYAQRSKRPGWQSSYQSNSVRHKHSTQ